MFTHATFVGAFPSVDGVKSAYIAHIALPCPADYVCDDTADITNIMAFLDDFAACDQQPAPCGSSNNADINADTVVDILDFLDFIDAFDEPCE